MPFDHRVVRGLRDDGYARDAIGREQPDWHSRMQGHSFEIQFQRFAIDVKSIHAVAIFGEIVGTIARRIVTQVCNVKLSVAIKNRLELARELGAVGETLVLGHGSQIDVTPGEAVIVAVAGFKKRDYGALRRVAIERVLAGLLRPSAETQCEKAQE